MKIDLINGAFRLFCDVQVLSKNRRFLLSIKSLNGTILSDAFEINYGAGEEILILKNIEEILQKFSIEYTMSDTVKNVFLEYTREQDNFSLFSETAKKIRDNEFADNPNLIELFDDFQKVVSEKIKKRTLSDLQMLSAFHMAFSQNSCNFSVPGAGKTTIVYAAYAYLKNLPESDSRHIDKLMIIGPISSFEPWEDQYFQCFGVSIQSTRLSGDSEVAKHQKIQHLYSGNPTELTLIHHGYVNALEKEIKDFLKKNKTMVVVDEAHRIKNALGLWGISATEISKYATSRIVLTGTPIPNGYEDLYNLYKFIYPFKFQEILKIHLPQLQDMTKNSDDSSPRVLDFINSISPYFIRIKKADLKLPKTDEKVILVDMDTDQKFIYDFIEKKYVKTFRNNSSGTIKDILNKAKLIRLRQAAINPGLLQETIKNSFEDDQYENINVFDGVVEEFQSDTGIMKKIQEYSSNHIPTKFSKCLEIIQNEIIPQKGKIIIWTIFIHNAEQLKLFLESQGIKSKLLIGKIDPPTRAETIRNFNNPDNNDFSVVIANPFSVAESISLHMGCHNALYLERDYNCSNFLQSKDRIHRVGLPKNQITTYYYLVTRDTVDDIINTKLEQKIKRMEAIIDGEIPLFGRIDNDDETDIIKAILEKYKEN